MLKEIFVKFGRTSTTLIFSEIKVNFVTVLGSVTVLLILFQIVPTLNKMLYTVNNSKKQSFADNCSTILLCKTESINGTRMK